MPEQCRNCRFWDAFTPEDDWSNPCRKRAPVYTLERTDRLGQPSTAWDYWCGDYKENPNAKTNETD